MTVRLRPMTADDLPAVMVLEEELFAPDTWTEAMYRDELSRADTRYYIVAEFHLEGEDDDEPEGGEPVLVGYGGLIAYDAEAHVATLGVATALQGEGVGSLLLDDLLAEADIVSVHVALTDDTRGLLDARRLGLMRDGACLVNTARGQIVDEPSLVRELVSGRLRAGLDVFADEPNVPSELFTLENVVMTPHLGTATQATREAMTRVLVDNLLAVERGKPPPNLV